MLKEFMQEIENLIEENERLRSERDEFKIMAIDQAQRLLDLEDKDLTVHRLEVAKPGASVWQRGSRRFAKRGDGRWTDMLAAGLYDSEQVLAIVPDGTITHE